MRARWVVLVAASCGRVGFDAHDAGSDIAPDAPLGLDVPFTSVVPFSDFNTTFDEDDASLTGDLLEIYFMSTRSGPEQLFAATRATTADSWGSATLVTELEMGGRLNNPKVTTDGLAIYFASQRAPNVGGGDLWVATRTARGMPWSPPQPIGSLNTTDHDFEPWIVDRGLELYYTIQPIGGGAPDLYVASRAQTTDPFANPRALTELNGVGFEGSLWVDATGLNGLFHSNRSGGQADILGTTRASTADPFGPPFVLAFVNDPLVDDTDAWLSPDGHTLVFTSDRAGNPNLFIATR